MTHNRGGCLCGAVRYEVAGDPLFTAVCHCRHCQRQTGSAFSVVTGFPGGGMTIHGATRVFDDIGESGQRVFRHFCGDCGSPIHSVLAALPEVTIVKSGTLDNFAGLTPSLEVFCYNAAGFLPAIEGTTRYPRSNLAVEA